MSGMEVSKPAWMLKQEKSNEKAAREAFEATFGTGDGDDPEDHEDDEDDDDDDAEKSQPLGPLCPARCSVSGKGLAGGQAGESVSLTVTAKDDAGQRITWGGAHVIVELKGGTSDSLVAANVKDCGTGEYIATYCVKEKGNYMLKVSVNGSETGGSPFPVYFSPPSSAAVSADGGALPVPSSTALQTITSTSLPAAGFPPLPGMAGTAAPAASMPLAQLLAAQVQSMPVPSLPGAIPLSMPVLPGAIPFPGAASGAFAGTGFFGLPIPGFNQSTAVDEMSRTVHVGNLTPFITAEQLRLLFSFYGTVADVRMAGDNNQYAFVEFSTAHEAAAAIAMNGQVIGDRSLKVEISKTARLVKPGNSAAAGLLGPHAAQIQQLTLAQLQQQQLAMQVAQMRVASKDASLAVNPENTAKAAAAALSKRLMGPPPAQEGSAAEHLRSRRSQSRSPRRHGDRSRHRSRSREHRRRRSASRERRRSPRRHRRRSHSRERRDSLNSDRRRSRSRDRSHGRAHRSKDGDREERHRGKKERVDHCTTDESKREPSKSEKEAAPDGKEAVADLKQPEADPVPDDSIPSPADGVQKNGDMPKDEAEEEPNGGKAADEPPAKDGGGGSSKPRGERKYRSRRSSPGAEDESLARKDKRSRREGSESDSADHHKRHKSHRHRKEHDLKGSKEKRSKSKRDKHTKRQSPRRRSRSASRSSG